MQDAELKAKVLEKASCDVRGAPQTLPLWAFRLCQHVNAGAYGFSEVWKTLEVAALDAGADESRVRRVLYSSFADAMQSDAEALPLVVLKAGLH